MKVSYRLIVGCTLILISSCAREESKTALNCPSSPDFMKIDPNISISNLDTFRVNLSNNKIIAQGKDMELNDMESIIKEMSKRTPSPNIQLIIDKSNDCAVLQKLQSLISDNYICGNGHCQIVD